MPVWRASTRRYCPRAPSAPAIPLRSWTEGGEHDGHALQAARRLRCDRRGGRRPPGAADGGRPARALLAQPRPGQRQARKAAADRLPVFVGGRAALLRRPRHEDLASRHGHHRQRLAGLSRPPRRYPRHLRGPARRTRRRAVLYRRHKARHPGIAGPPQAFRLPGRGSLSRGPAATTLWARARKNLRESAMARGPGELAVTLDDKYVLEKGRIYLTGTQALVRLPMLQRQRDAAAGLNTGCFISGYRGSPLGGFDQALWSARRFVERSHIKFQPAINEELAATAVWGSQQLGLFPGAKYDGVFAVWYGKGPGVDRSGDALKHGNSAGTAPYGGVLALAGDDHTCKSSTLAHQSEFAFIDALIPVLNPAGVEEILDLGLYGWAMSRYSGCWVAFKTVAETMDSSASIAVAPDRVRIVLPEDFAMPPGGLNIRWPDPPLDQELRLHRYKLPAALAFARANRLDRIVIDAPTPRFGIVTTGKSYLDVRQALDELGIGEAEAAALGLRLYKVAMPWPLEPDGARDFADGLAEVLVVEEKRAVIETQLKEQLYNWPADRRPRLVGKCDVSGEWMLPSNGELSPGQIARVIARRLAGLGGAPWLAERIARLDARERPSGGNVIAFARTPYFCSGCPHNTSTRVPNGSRALAGIGCHYLSQFMDRNTATFTQMGGEGAAWIGQAPFTETQHVFANIGDGTYTHSGIMAVRAAVASGVNMTYKVLFNDAVAMTGGHPLDGGLTVPRVAPQEARPFPRSAAAGLYQRIGLRRVRRLLGHLELPVGGACRDRVRPQAG